MLFPALSPNIPILERNRSFMGYLKRGHTEILLPHFGIVDFFLAKEGKRFGFLKSKNGVSHFFHFGDGFKPVKGKMRTVELITPENPLPDPKKGDEIIFTLRYSLKGPAAQSWVYASEYFDLITKVYPPVFGPTYTTVKEVGKKKDGFTGLVVTGSGTEIYISSDSYRVPGLKESLFGTPEVIYKQVEKPPKMPKIGDKILAFFVKRDEVFRALKWTESNQYIKLRNKRNAELVSLNSW